MSFVMDERIVPSIRQKLIRVHCSRIAGLKNAIRPTFHCAFLIVPALQSTSPPKEVWDSRAREVTEGLRLVLDNVGRNGALFATPPYRNSNVKRRSEGNAPSFRPTKIQI